MRGRGAPLKFIGTVFLHIPFLITFFFAWLVLKAYSTKTSN